MSLVGKLGYPLVFLMAMQCAFTGTAEAADAPIVVVVKVFPGAGRENELQARYEKELEFLRRSEPKVLFRLHRSIGEPTYFLWYETYPTQSDLDHHLKSVVPAFKKEFGATPDGLIARPSESVTYREITK